MCIYMYTLIASLSSTGEIEENRSNQWRSKCQLLTFTTTGKDTIECVDFWLTTKAVQRDLEQQTQTTMRTQLCPGVVQQDHHWTTQWPCSNEQKELLGSQHSWRGPAEHWLASKRHLAPIMQYTNHLTLHRTQLTLPRLSLGQEHTGLQHHHQAHKPEGRSPRDKKEWTRASWSPGSNWLTNCQSNQAGKEGEKCREGTDYYISGVLHLGTGRN